MIWGNYVRLSAYPYFTDSLSKVKKKLNMYDSVDFRKFLHFKLTKHAFWGG